MPRDSHHKRPSLNPVQVATFSRAARIMDNRIEDEINGTSRIRAIVWSRFVLVSDTYAFLGGEFVMRLYHYRDVCCPPEYNAYPLV